MDPTTPFFGEQQWAAHCTTPGLTGAPFLGMDALGQYDPHFLGQCDAQFLGHCDPQFLELAAANMGMLGPQMPCPGFMQLPGHQHLQQQLPQQFPQPHLHPERHGATQRMGCAPIDANIPRLGGRQKGSQPKPRLQAQPQTPTAKSPLPTTPQALRGADHGHRVSGQQPVEVEEEDGSVCLHYPPHPDQLGAGEQMPPVKLPSTARRNELTGDWEETDPQRVHQRQKQIWYGKVTCGYRNYAAAVPQSERQPDNDNHPQTPRCRQVCSKRSWDSQVSVWRRALHAWDCKPSTESMRIGGSSAARSSSPSPQTSVGYSTLSRSASAEPHHQGAHAVPPPALPEGQRIKCKIQGAKSWKLIVVPHGATWVEFSQIAAAKLGPLHRMWYEDAEGDSLDIDDDSSLSVFLDTVGKSSGSPKLLCELELSTAMPTAVQRCTAAQRRGGPLLRAVEKLSTLEPGRARELRELLADLLERRRAEDGEEEVAGPIAQLMSALTPQRPTQSLLPGTTPKHTLSTLQSPAMPALLHPSPLSRASIRSPRSDAAGSALCGSPMARVPPAAAPPATPPAATPDH